MAAMGVEARALRWFLRPLTNTPESNETDERELEKELEQVLKLFPSSPEGLEEPVVDEKDGRNRSG